MKLNYFKNEGDGVYSILLHGIVGEEIDGQEIASEILMLDNMGAKIIKERINTIGGSIIDGFSIVSANLVSQAEIHTFNEGVADSTGSWILASGTPGKRGGFDFSSVFLHNPTYQDKPIEEVEDEGLRRDLTVMTESIITILTNNGKKTRDEIKRVMEKKKRMTAIEAKEFGIIDIIEKSQKKPAFKENMAMADVMNICHEFNNKSQENNNLNKNKTMKTVAKFFNLSEEATEDSILEEVQKLKNKTEKAEKALSDEKVVMGKKDTEITNLKKEVKDLKDKATEQEKASIETAVNMAIESKKYKEEDKEELVTMVANMGLENFNKMIEKQVTPHVDVLNNINSDGSKKPATDKEVEKDKALAKEFENMSKNDPDGLAKLEITDKKKFDEMYAASEKYDMTVEEK